MFYGTRWFYKVLYFLTAMSPAYFLFLLQVDDKFKNPFNYEWEINELIIHINIYWWCGLLLLLLIFLSSFLRWLLIRQYIHSSTDQILSPEKVSFNEGKLTERNGNVISFLLGNILPAVLIIESDLIIAVSVFIIIQILIYILIMKSTDIFPNISLIILGMNICKTQDNKYVFTFKSKQFEELKVYMIGNPEKTKIYITMYKK